MIFAIFSGELQLTNSLFSVFPGRITAMQKKFMTRTLVLVSALLVLTGCGAGPNAPTRLINQVTDGVEKKIDDIKLLHMLLVAQGNGSAVLVGTIINDGANPDQVTSISANGIPAQLTPATLVVTQNTPLIFAGDSANALAVIPGLNVKPGSHAMLSITLGKTGSTTLEVLVRDKSAEFANVGPVLVTN